MATFVRQCRPCWSCCKKMQESSHWCRQLVRPRPVYCFQQWKHASVLHRGNTTPCSTLTSSLSVLNRANTAWYNTLPTSASVLHGDNSAKASTLLTSFIVLYGGNRSRYSTLPSSFAEMTLKNKLFSDYVQHLVQEYEELCKQKPERQLFKSEANRLYQLEKLVDCYELILAKYGELEGLLEMVKDEGLKDMATEEVDTCKQLIQQYENDLVGLVSPDTRGPYDDYDVFLEVECGAGGKESMLFAQEILDMYERYAQLRGWEFTAQNIEKTEGIRGIRKACVGVSGQGVYRLLKYEGGVHRVKRVPATETAGRIHTSTITVAILQQPSEIDLELKPSDLEITACKSSGPGGQHVNTTDSAVRIKHIPTGLVVECQADRSQIRNKKLALAMLRSRILQRELAAQTSITTSQRKIQVGDKERSGRIRTYTFNHDTVTDHRLGKQVKGVADFLSGGQALDEMIQDLQTEAQLESLQIKLQEFQAMKSSETSKKLKKS